MKWSRIEGGARGRMRRKRSRKKIPERVWEELRKSCWANLHFDLRLPMSPIGASMGPHGHIAELKNMPPPAAQSLVWKGQVLDDMSSLAEQGIDSNGAIVLVRTNPVDALLKAGELRIVRYAYEPDTEHTAFFRQLTVQANDLVRGLEISDVGWAHGTKYSRDAASQMVLEEIGEPGWFPEAYLFPKGHVNLG